MRAEFRLEEIPAAPQGGPSPLPWSREPPRRRSLTGDELAAAVQEGLVGCVVPVDGVEPHAATLQPVHDGAPASAHLQRPQPQRAAQLQPHPAMQQLPAAVGTPRSPGLQLHRQAPHAARDLHRRVQVQVRAALRGREETARATPRPPNLSLLRDPVSR